MNKACDLLALAIESYRSGELNAAAKFFTSAMGSDDLDSFVTEITKTAPRSALQGVVPTSENTISPSLASAACASSEYSIEAVVDLVEARFRAEASFLDDDETETEVRASGDDEEEDSELDDEDDEDELDDESLEDEDFEIEASSTKVKIVAAFGPVRLKK